jgi:hypothetical protein
MTNTMTNGEFVQSSQAFTKKETIDIKVGPLKKGKKVIFKII